MSQRIVVNRCYGGFGLSRKAMERLVELGHGPVTEYMIEHDKKYKNDQFLKNYFHPSDDELKRDDALLVKVVDELGSEANGEHAELEVVEIPDGVEWEIDEYDGTEWIAEKHRRW